MTDIRLRNSKTRSIVPLRPIDPRNVRMYVCGPTVYDRAHLGNARPAVVFDALFRLLRHVHGATRVKYVRNFTDVDDKINARAAETGRSISDITNETIRWYLEDTAAIGVLDPTHMPRATDHVGDMIAMIASLMERGNAYEAEGHVLFSVASFPGYGALSRRSIADMTAQARIEAAPYKRNPMDFVLWKPSDAETPGWDSPWGRGRPGWHIECSAMSAALLGESFDIHGGGSDLMFPHHENEIAQSACAHPDAAFANIWMHNGMLLVEGKKMSKSLGNFLTVRDLLNRGVPGEAIRFVLLSTHYAKSMDWTERKVSAAMKTLRHWRVLTRDAADSPPHSEVVAALADDLNTSGALAVLHRLASDGSAAALRGSAALLGLLDDGVDAVPIDALIWPRKTDQAARLCELRARALETGDFGEVDAMKAALTAAGVEVRMSKSGIDLVPGPGFDPAKLERV